MRKFSPPVKVVIFAAFVSLVMLSCKMDDDGTIPRFGPKVEGAELSGTWTAVEGDSIKIDKDSNTFTYWFGNTPDYTGGYSMDYSGNIVGEVLADKTLLQSKFGYLTIEVTAAGVYGPGVGKFIAIYWKDLSSSGTVKEGGPYKETGNNSGTATIAEAEAEYTVENGYFDRTGTYSKH
jgi:hypothetical protein